MDNNESDQNLGKCQKLVGRGYNLDGDKFAAIDLLKFVAF